MQDINVRIKRLCWIRAGEETLDPVPGSATAGCAGFDLRAAIDAPVRIYPGQTRHIPTGIAVELPPGVAMVLLPRSGSGHDRGIVLGSLVGLVDGDHRDGVFVSVCNRNDSVYPAGHRGCGVPPPLITRSYLIEPGERIARAMFLVTPQVSFDVVEPGQGEAGRGVVSDAGRAGRKRIAAGVPVAG